jgi:hypothetical protein
MIKPLLFFHLIASPFFQKAALKFDRHDHVSLRRETQVMFGETREKKFQNYLNKI